MVFDDHEHLSNFIFNMCKIDEDFAELGRLTQAGFTGANDKPVLWLRRLVSAMQAELKELDESLPWKWWRHEHSDLQNVHVELIDLFHFLVSAAQVSGLNGSDFLKLYYKKRKINYERQVSGFRPDDNKEVVL